MSDKFNGSFLLSDLVNLKNSDEGVAVLLLRPHSLKVLWHLAEVINWPKFITDDVNDPELLRDIRNEIYTDNSMVYVNLDQLLTAINTTLNERLQGIENAILSGGSGSGDGSGNTIQDLIFWIKILFAVTGGGLAEGGATITPILSLINSSITAGNLNQIMAILNESTLDTRNNAELQDIADKLQLLVEKDCSPSLVNSVSLPSDILDQGYNLIKNGNWIDGSSNNIPNAFYPDYWLVVGNPSNGEYPTRSLVNGIYVLGITTETTCIVRQSAVIPAGYTMPKLVCTLPAGGSVEFGAARFRVYVNNSLVNLSVVESTDIYFEADFSAAEGDVVKIELDASGGGSLAKFGVLELFVWPTGITVNNQVTMPQIGGSMGKGRNRAIKPDKRLWETAYGSQDSEDNWLVDKLEDLGDWWGMVLRASKEVVRSLSATRIFRMDTTTKLCNVYFNTSIDPGGPTNITVDMFNGSTWETIRTCTITGSYVTKVDFPEFVGDKLIRISFNPTIAAGGQDFWFYDLEIEEID